MKHLQNFNRILDLLAKKYPVACQKHPDFAYGVYHALGYLGEEYGEVAKEITKQHDGWEQRMDSELVDLIIVAIRILNREYVHELDD